MRCTLLKFSSPCSNFLIPRCWTMPVTDKYFIMKKLYMFSFEFLGGKKLYKLKNKAAIQITPYLIKQYCTCGGHGICHPLLQST